LAVLAATSRPSRIPVREIYDVNLEDYD